MKKYKVLLMRLGEVLLQAENETDVLSQLETLSEKRIKWLPAPSCSHFQNSTYIIASIKEIDN